MTAKALLKRRRFLKKTAQAALAAPLFASFSSLRAFGATPEASATTPALTPAPTPTELPPAKPKLTLNVRDYGASGDGKTKDTRAIQQTIERCAAFGGGEVLVPAGSYLTGALKLHSGVVLRLAEGATLNGSPDITTDYPLQQVRWEGHWMQGYSALICAIDAQDIGIVGPGRIVASAAIQGRLERPSGLRLPALLEFMNCRNVTVENCYTEQTGMWSIHPTNSDNVTFRNVVVKSGADGIDVDSCKHVVIDGCDFDTTDDCISLKSGRGMEGYAIFRPTEDVVISNCSFRDKKWACIGIGSETSGGIRNVRVEHCKFLSAGTYAVYIKTRVGRGAFIENISMNDLEVSGARQGFLRFNMLSSGITDTPNLVPGEEGIPTIRNFSFTNVHVTDMPELVHGLDIHPLKPLDGFTLANITGTCATGISLANIKHADISNIKVTGYDGPLLSIHNVSGSGLSGAMEIDTLPVEGPIPAPATPYHLH